MFGDQNLQERLKTCSVHAESEHRDEEDKDYIINLRCLEDVTVTEDKKKSLYCPKGLFLSQD